MHLCLAVSKIKRRMRMRMWMRSRGARDLSADTSFISHGDDARDTQPSGLGSWAWERLDSRALGNWVYPLPQRPWERQKSARTDRGVRGETCWYGGLKKNCSLSSGGQEGELKGERERERNVFCSHLARSVIQNDDTGSWRQREEGEQRSPQFHV